jgi:hypothetical protein
MQVSAPTLLTWPAVFIFSAYGLLLLLPALLSVLFVSTMSFSLLTYALPVLTLAVATLFLPFGFGNSYAARLVSSLKPEPCQSVPFLVQLTFSPRLRSGLRLLLEDADDLGWLSCGETALTFRGDSVQLDLPYSQIRAAQRQNAGWRGLFLYSHLAVEFQADGQVRTLLFAERSSFTVPQSRRVGGQLYHAVAAKLKRA